MDSRTRIRVNAPYEAELENRCHATRAPRTAAVTPPSSRRPVVASRLRSPASPTPWTRVGRRESERHRRRVRASPPAMRQEQNGTGKAHRPVKHRHDEALILVPEVVEQVRAQHEPAHEHDERDSRPDAAPGPPARDDVRAPEKTERPDRGEREGAVKAQPPGLERVDGAEPALAFQQIVKEEPQGSGEPKPGSDDMDDEPRDRRHASAGVRSGSPTRSHTASPRVCQPLRAVYRCAVARYRCRIATP